MRRGDALERLAALRVVPVVELHSAEAGVALAGALADGGLPVVEVTLRTTAATEAIAAIVRAHPQVLVGAGTILDRAGLDAAAAAGAAFGVSPGFDPALSAAAAAAGLPYVPGASTASEIQAALRAGHRLVKFFPAEACGGIAGLRALGAPFAFTGLRFMATGGVGEANAAAYLAEPLVAAVGGSWIAPGRDLAAGAWDDITARARRAVEATAVRSAR